MLIGPGGVQDALGVVLVKFFGLLVGRGRFCWPSWAHFGVVLGCCGGRLGAFSAFQLIDSTHQPWALQHCTTRPGGLREAINNAVA